MCWASGWLSDHTCMSFVCFSVIQFQEAFGTNNLNRRISILRTNCKCLKRSDALILAMHLKQVNLVLISHLLLPIMVKRLINKSIILHQWTVPQVWGLSNLWKILPMEFVLIVLLLAVNGKKCLERAQCWHFPKVAPILLVMTFSKIVQVTFWLFWYWQSRT